MRAILATLALAGCVTVEVVVSDGSSRARGAAQDVGQVTSNTARLKADVPVSVIPK